jgi:hypothetical protein
MLPALGLVGVLGDRPPGGDAIPSDLLDRGIKDSAAFRIAADWLDLPAVFFLGVGEFITGTAVEQNVSYYIYHTEK